MFDPLPNVREDHFPTTTSSVSFLRTLEKFLGRNQIEAVENFRIRLEPTSDGHCTLSITGQSTAYDWSACGQPAIELAWLGLPGLSSPSEDVLPDDTDELGSTMACGFSQLTYVEGPMEEDGALQMPFIPSNSVSSLSGFDQDGPLGNLDSLTDSTIVPTGDQFILDNGSYSAPSCLYNNVEPLLSGTQSLSTDGAIASLAKNTNVAYDTTTPSKRKGHPTGQDILSSGKAAQCQRRTPQGSSRLLHRRAKNVAPAGSSSYEVAKTLSQNILCDDLHNVLESALPRWTREGLWHEMPSRLTKYISSKETSDGGSLHSAPSYAKLEWAYRAVCLLNSRMRDDLIRDRMALIHLYLEYTETHNNRRRASSSDRVESTVGRGDASHVIDCILESIHDGWKDLDHQRRAELRARFHDRKKCGKRWARLVDVLGPGILLICSTRLANAVRSTTVTAKILEAMMEHVKSTDPEHVRLMCVVSPLAECLMKNEGFDQFAAADILRQVHCPSQCNLQQQGDSSHMDLAI